MARHQRGNAALRDLWMHSFCFLCAGYLTAWGDTDEPRKYWARLTDAGRAALAAGKPPDAPETIEFNQQAGDFYDVVEKQVRAELEAAEPENPNDICIPIPCGVGWGGCYTDWFLPGQAPEDSVSMAESLARRKTGSRRMTRRRPKPPVGLDAAAGEKWAELLPQLPDWEPATLDCLEQYSVAWSKWLAAKDSNVKVRWSRCCRQWMQSLGCRHGPAGRPPATVTAPATRF